MANGFIALEGSTAALDNLGPILMEQARKGMVSVMASVAGRAKELAPVDTGRLRNSIGFSVTGEDGPVEGKVFANVEYAPYVEFGTGEKGRASPHTEKERLGVQYSTPYLGKRAQPFLWPAFRQIEPQIPRIFQSVMDGGLDAV